MEQHPVTTKMQKHWKHTSSVESANTRPEVVAEELIIARPNGVEHFDLLQQCLLHLKVTLSKDCFSADKGRAITERSYRVVISLDYTTEFIVSCAKVGTFLLLHCEQGRMVDHIVAVISDDCHIDVVIPNVCRPSCAKVGTFLLMHCEQGRMLDHIVADISDDCHTRRGYTERL
ncbi:hypothetical protein J6590_070971 [Homalodisca vitripennis]|nr:hypothetical protein J6590_070971 [Homalodisca vitripennis]